MCARGGAQTIWRRTLRTLLLDASHLVPTRYSCSSSRVEMLKLDFCCFCVPLRKGALIGAALQAIYGIWKIVEGFKLANDPHFHVESYDNLTKREVAVIHVHSHVCMLASLLGTMDVFISLVLVLGALKEDAKLVKAWLIATFALYIISIMFTIATIILTTSAHLGAMQLHVFVYVFFPATILKAYLLLVVYNYHQLLEKASPPSVHFTADMSPTGSV